MLTSKSHKLLFAAAREHDALLAFLAAPHNSVLTVNRQMHRLRAIKLRVTECRQAPNQVLRFLGNTLLAHVKHVRFYYANRLRKVLRSSTFNLVRESRRQKTFRTHSSMGRTPRKRKLPQRTVNSRICNSLSKTGGNLGDGGQEPPLIGKCHEIVVNKNRIRLPLRLPLKRQRNQVAKTALGNGGLRRKKPIIRLKAHSRCLRHRIRDDSASKIARKLGIDRLLEEKPDMRAVPRSGSLHSGMQAEASARISVQCRFALPTFFVEIGNQYPRRAVRQQHIHAHHVATIIPFALKMFDKSPIVDWDESPCRAIRALYSPVRSRPMRAVLCSLVGARRRVPYASAFPSETVGAHILTSFKQRFEKRNLVPSRTFRCD